VIPSTETSRLVDRPKPLAAAGAALSLESLPPLTGPWIESLAPAAEGAVLTLPLGAREPRPLIIGVHGAGDRPEWSCGGWRLASGAKAFVLCPRGSKLDPQRFAWASAKALERTLDQALTELRRRYARYLADGPVIYAGFSQGATLAEPILRTRARELPIAILAEGGYQTARNAEFGGAYRAAGGRRIILVCGSPGCFRNAAVAKPVLERAGLEALVVGDEKAGHNLNERMQVALQRAWPEIAAPLKPVLLSH
jgi:predicted esterase